VYHKKKKTVQKEEINIRFDKKDFGRVESESKWIKVKGLKNGKKFTFPEFTIGRLRRKKSYRYSIIDTENRVASNHRKNIVD